MKHLARALIWMLAVTALVWVPPSSAADPSGSLHAERARESAAWLVAQLDEHGQMPGPGGRSDTGLVIDVLWALHATDAGAQQADAITQGLREATGEYIGADLFRRAEARLAAQTAKLLVTAVVSGADPTDFGTGRFLATGESYDLRAETLALVTPDGPRAGRVANTGTGRDDSNIFGQAFATIGLARSGHVPGPVVDYLASQQCSGGWFRMFLNDDLTCDAANGAPDGDGTALALQALMVADAHGYDGLDAAIDRGLEWLVSVQQPDGSFAGGTATATGNANSTGLVVQALVAGAERLDGPAAVRLRTSAARAQDWITSVHVHSTNPAAGKLVEDGETGAIAYDRPALAAAAADGIGTGLRDQWRRATAQALLALAPVSMADLGEEQLEEDLPPTVPTTQPDPEPTPDPVPTPEPVPDPTATPTPIPTQDPVPRPTPTPDPTGPAAPAPRGPDLPTTGTAPLPRVPVTDPAPTRPPRTGEAPSSVRAGSPSQRLEQYLLGHLTGGTHVRSVVNGSAYVDHELTVDVLLALHALDTDSEALARITRFLARPAQVSAYAFGAPYEEDAAYGAALARLALALRLGSGVGVDGPVVRRSLERVDSALRSLDSVDGLRTDRGEHPDAPTDTVRQGWIALALTAADDPDAEAARTALGAARCADGTYAADLATACTAGNAGATALALAALSSSPTTMRVSPGTAQVHGLRQSARTVTAAVATVGVSGIDATELRDLADLTVAARLLGTAPARPSPAVVSTQQPNGSFAVADGRGDLALSAAMAPVLSGRTWLEAPSSPVHSVLPAGWLLGAGDSPGAAGSRGAEARTTAVVVAGAAGLLGGALLTLLATGALRRRTTRSIPTTLTTGATR